MHASEVERAQRRPTIVMLPTSKSWRLQPSDDNTHTASLATRQHDHAVADLPLISLPPELLGHIAGHLGPAGLLGMARADRTTRAACAASIDRLLRSGSALSLGGFTPTQRLVLLAHAEGTADRALETEGAAEVFDELRAIAQSGRCRNARASGWRSSWVGRLVQRLWTPSWLTVHAELIAALVLARWCELAEDQGDAHILMYVRVGLAAAWQRLKDTSSSSWMCIAALALKHDHVSAEIVCTGMHAIASDIHYATDSRRQRAVEAGALEAVVAALRTYPQEVAVQQSGAVVLAYICDCTGNTTPCTHTPVDAGPWACGNRRQRAVEAGAVEALVAASQAHPQATALQYYTHFALTSICADVGSAADGRRQRAAEAGALEAAVAALWAHLHDGDGADANLRHDLRHQCMWVISDVCAGMDISRDGMDVSRVQRAVEAGALEAVVATMKAHCMDAGLQCQAIWVLDCICDGDSVTVESHRRRAAEAGAPEGWWYGL